MLDRLRRLIDRADPVPVAAPAPPAADLGPALRAALGLASAGRHDEARAALRALQADHPGHAEVAFALGRVELACGRPDAAAEAFAESLAGEREPSRRDRTRLFLAQARARADLARGRRPADHQRHGATATRVSVIIPSVTPEKFARAAASFAAAFTGIEHEIIGIHDGRSMCEACNRGARQAAGDVLVFAHDDVEAAAPDFAARLLDHLAQVDVVGIAGTTRLVGPAWAAAGPPHVHGQVGYRGAGGRIELVAFGLDAPLQRDAQALDGCFLAARRHVVEESPFDERTFAGWHLYDVDFTFSAWLAGFAVGVCEDLLLIHQSRGTYGAEWQRSAGAFTAKHRASLPPPAPVAPVAVQGLVLDGIDEWRLVTGYLVGGKEPSCWNDC